ncbi:helix-turn-helix domain-containing protein [Actinoplanes palleronii]|uniref:Transcriptional regulator n=1 Tax=Actinoplanes palleronii TaxID=113570 RepID=A0ABQ4BNR8_9ACTN|nr:helix-turn-helix transcriptional regulator [Actinoplanes palleronii]GIE72329.1 transcriptional regulator [Actinoplanes palleronii]
MLGIDGRAEKVYRAMLANPGWGVGEIGEHLVLAEDEVRTALDKLFELALLSPSMEAPGAMRPVRPDVGLSALLARRQADLARQQHEIAASHAAIAEMVAECAVLRPETTQPDYELLTGMDAIQSRLEQLAVRATFECLSFMPGGGQSPASLAASRPLDEASLLRGVSLRTVYQESVRNDQATVAYAQWLVQAGGEVGTVPVLPPRMVIVDQEVALLPADPQNSRAGAVQITGRGMIASLLTLFEQVWTAAAPLGAEPEPDEEGLTPQHRELLLLLAQGMTDEVTAKRLSVSTRTARRMVADLMDRLGARSRFEAGLRAAKRGWL